MGSKNTKNLHIGIGAKHLTAIGGMVIIVVS
jgi:hypothetical protein